MSFFGRQGLPPTQKSTDGVPFKIGDDFIPPAKVTLPLNFNYGNPTDALFMDYDFSLEGKVIEWTDLQRKLQAQATATRKARLAQKEEEEAKAKEQQEAEQNERQEVESEATAISNGEVAAASSLPSNIPQAQASFQPPFANFSSGSILMPAAAPLKVDAKANETLPQTKRATSFDLADFEQEQDPFEHMELKVLDDMAELDKVLQSTQSDNKEPKATAQTNDASQAVADLSLTENPPVASNSTATASQSIKDVDYPDIDSIGSTDSALSIRSGSSHGMQPSLQQSLPTHPQLNHQSMPSGNASVVALPPMPSNGSLVGQQPSSVPQPPPSYSASLAPMYSISQAPSTSYTQAKTYSSFYQTSQNSHLSMQQQQQQQQLPVVPTMWNSSIAAKTTNTSNDFLAKYGQNSNNNSIAAQASTSGQLRRNKSTPDIHSLVQEERRVMPTSHTPPPYRTKTPPPHPPKPVDLSQAENNRHSPRYGGREAGVSITGTTAKFSSMGASPPLLPTMSSSSSPSPSPSRASLPSASSAKASPPSAVVPTRPAPKLPDPYRQMTLEAQRFVNNIADMGFPKARVARAVDKLGQDDKKVVDHLCAINRLEDMGFSPEPAELALQMFENKVDKAEKYLNLVTRFKDFGFSEAKIREALMKNNLDEDKTLDCLTATS